MRINRNGRGARPALALLCAGLLLVGAACNDDDDGQGKAKTNDALQQTREITIEIRENGLEPGQVRIQTGEPVRFTVVNKSSKGCSFGIEQLLQRLETPPGETKTMALTVPVSPSNPGQGTQTAAMGCENDQGRQGTVTLLNYTGER